MIGQRGVPATFGGIERHVEELGARLVDRGHEVTVFCRSNYDEQGRPSTHRGMRLHWLPTVGTKHLDAVVHSAMSAMTAMGDRPDIVHFHAIGPGLVAPLPRLLSSAKVVLTVHGLDNERAKWGRGARALLSAAAWMSARVPDATIVVSEALRDHYAERYDRITELIANGVDARPALPPVEIASRFGLRSGSYVLFVGRLVPEKAPHLLIRAFATVDTDIRLVIVGGSSFSDAYVAELAELARHDHRVLMPGYVYGDALRELYSNAAAFVLPSALEGLPLTLLEAASYGVPLVASAIAPHVEVLRADGPGRRLFEPGDMRGLAGALTRVLAQHDQETAGAAAVRRDVLGRYDWDVAAERTEQLYLDLVGVRAAVPV